jgi:hypothetical protein
LCRRLDALGCKRRGNKPWIGSHSLVRAILHRAGVLSAEDARTVIRQRIEEAKRRGGELR